MDIRKIIVSIFIKLKDDTYVLIRIEALVALVTALFFAMIIVDFYRCRYRSSFLTKVFKVVDSLSDRILLYLLGSMQSASFENQMFPVWAVVLVSLRASLGYLSGYGIQEQHRRLSELGNVVKFIGTGVLNHTRALKFTRPLWSLWAILLARSLYRFVAHEMAIRSLLHGRNAEFLPEYMRDGASDPEEGQGHRGHNDNDEDFLVCGESNKNIRLRKPAYTLHLENVEPSSLITVKKISGCQGPLLRSSNRFSSRYKDMSLAFALSRLLRCKFEDVTLQNQSIARTRNLITSKMIESQQTAAAQDTIASLMATVPAEMLPEEARAKRAFKILELELAFSRDYFHTLYPLVFWWGLGSLCFSLLLSVATFGIALWLAVDIRKVYHQARDKNNFMLQMHGGNVDVLITWLFMAFMMFKELWEIITYLVSNWTRLLLVCKYVEMQLWFEGIDEQRAEQERSPRVHLPSPATSASGCGGAIELCRRQTSIIYGSATSWFWRLLLKDRLMRSFYKEHKIAGAWHGSMDQYDFLQSCNYKPLFRKAVTAISLGMIKAKSDGRKSGKAIKVPECVKTAILRALDRIKALTCTQLPRDVPSLEGMGQYSWACLDQQTCSQVILVWHIATSLCEIKLAEECGIDLTKPGFLRSAWSRLKTFSCCTSEPYLVKKNTRLHGELQTNYHIATSLSRYCAHLQAFRSTLLPDSFVVPAVIFMETIKDAREILNDCNLVKCRYRKLMATADPAAGRKEDMNIVQKGATLAEALMKENKENRWKIIAEVWADLLVHIAPSWNTADHKYCLESGGEFLTLIWVLLSHCGIEKSCLWDKDEAPATNGQVPQQNNTDQISNVHAVHEQQVSERNGQVPQENNTDQTSNVHAVDEQQVSECNGQVLLENNTDQTSDAQAVDDQSDGDGTGSGEDSDTRNFT